MSQYPRPLTQRWDAALAALQSRLSTVENRTMGIDSGGPLAALPAVVDGSYSSGDPRVYINGSATLTGPYQHLASYTPAANDAVLVMPVVLSGAQSFVVLGKLA